MSLANTPWPKTYHDARNSCCANIQMPRGPDTARPFLQAIEPIIGPSALYGTQNRWENNVPYGRVLARFFDSGNVVMYEKQNDYINCHAKAISADGALYISFEYGGLWVFDASLVYPDGSPVVRWTNPDVRFTNLGADGKVYCHSRYDDAVCALDSAGNLLWWTSVPGTFGITALSPNEDTLYMRCAVDPNYRGLFAIDTAGGGIKWFVPTETGISWPPAVGLDGTVYINDCGKLYAIDPAGYVRWVYDSELTTSYGPPAVSPDGQRVYAAFGNTVRAIRCSDGALLWTYTLFYDVTASPVVGNNGLLCFANCREAKLYIVWEADGSYQFAIFGADIVRDYYPRRIILGEGAIYVATDQNIYCCEIVLYYTSREPADGYLREPGAKARIFFNDYFAPETVNKSTVPVSILLPKCERVPFSWREAQEGTPVSFNDPDEGVGSFSPVSFNLVFGGAPVGTVWVCTNGYLSFDTQPLPKYWVQRLPTSYFGADRVVCLWTDFVVGSGSQVLWFILADRTPRELVVTYRDIELYDAPGTFAFQFVFPEGRDEVILNFKDLECDGDPYFSFGREACVGFQTSSTSGYMYSYKPRFDAIPNGTAVKFFVGDAVYQPTTNYELFIDGGYFLDIAFPGWPSLSWAKVELTSGIMNLTRTKGLQNPAALYFVIFPPGLTQAYARAARLLADARTGALVSAIKTGG